MFCREFAAQDTVVLLDGIMSKGGSGSKDAAGLPVMVGSIAVAMVIMVEDSVVRARDENDILEALMRYKFPGGGDTGDGKYVVMGKARMEELLLAATEISQGRDPGLCSRGGLGVGAVGTGKGGVAEAPPHSLEGVVEGAGNVLEAFTKTSSSVIKSIADSVTRDRPNWLMGQGQGEEVQGMRDVDIGGSIGSKLGLSEDPLFGSTPDPSLRAPPPSPAPKVTNFERIKVSLEQSYCGYRQRLR